MPNIKQNKLVAALASRNIKAIWDDSGSLNCTYTYTDKNNDINILSWGVGFDDPAELDGPRVGGAVGHPLIEDFGRNTFFECLRLGPGGDEEALDYVNECRTSGLQSGATEEWLNLHRGQLTEIIKDQNNES